MESDVIKNVHSKGHLAVKKTKDVIEQKYFIPCLQEKIEKIINSCVSCILPSRKTGKREVFLNPLPKEYSPLFTYHVDHMGPLKTTNKNYNHILIVTGVFTGFV